MTLVHPSDPVFHTLTADVNLIGAMAIYASQAEASQQIPSQWRDFRAAHPALLRSSELYGASPCTHDGKIHYLTGVAQKSLEIPVTGELMTLAAGEYALVRVEDATQLRNTWTWLLNDWLPRSGRKEKHAPEFERYAGISEAGTPVGPVEIWIPLEPLAKSSEPEF